MIPVSDISAELIIAVITSVMYMKSLVCEPSPNIIGGLLFFTSFKNRLITLESFCFLSSPGPYAA